MQNKKVMKAILTVAAVVMLAGCSQSTTDNTPSSDAQSQVKEQSQSQPQEQSQDQNTQGEENALRATVTVNCAYENGTPDIVEMLNIGNVNGQPDETGHIITGYDADGNLVYRREDTSFTDDKGILNVTITYEFYSLAYDFDFEIDPLDPENGGNIQTINGSIVVKNETGETSKDFTFETVGIRGQTGIWYAGICSCRDGVLGDYITQ